MLRRLRALLGRARREREMQEELSLHLEQETEQHERRGLPPEEARRRAGVAFGRLEAAKEACRDAWGGGWLENLGRDLRYGLRGLRRSPGYAAVVVATLALGIGANTAIFSVVHGVLIRPLPYAAGERLVELKHTRPRAGDGDAGVSVLEVGDYAGRARELDAVVEYHSMSFTLFGGPDPLRVTTGVVSADFFRVLGVAPLMGRDFLPGEDAHGAEPVLLLSHRFWHRSLGGDPGVLGRRFEMNDRVHVVVGVLPPLPAYPDDNDVWMPASACPFRSRPEVLEGRDRRMVAAYARLRPGATLATAETEANGILGQLAREFPAAYPDGDFAAELEPVSEQLTGRARPTLIMLLATVGLVLLIACANVANLALARLASREHELAVRAALGASRGRLLRQLITESVLLALIGGLLGLALASAGLDLLTAFASRFTPRAADIAIDGAVLGFCLALSVATGLVFGSLPGLPSSRVLATALKDAGGRSGASAPRSRLRTGLVVAQLAVSFTLVTVSALLLRSLVKLNQVDPGFRAENVLTLQLYMNWASYRSDTGGADQVRLAGFYRPLLERVEALPGVRSAGLSWTIPLNTTFRADGSYRIEGREAAPGVALPRADFRAASPNYFDTLGIPVSAGRAFDARDGEAEAERVVMVSQSLARRDYPGEDAVGRRISLDGEQWWTIVGVAGDVRQYSLDQPPAAEIYLPILRTGAFGSTLALRAAGSPDALVREVRGLIRQLDPHTAVAGVRTLESVRRDSLAPPRLTAALVGLFAALALAITAAGVGGVIAYSVSRRTQELGVRLALGAPPRAVLGLLMREGLGSALAGLALGAIGALALGRLVSGLLYGVSATDPTCFAGSALLFLAVSAVATFLPARRAVAIDPMAALRAQ